MHTGARCCCELHSLFSILNAARLTFNWSKKFMTRKKSSRDLVWHVRTDYVTSYALTEALFLSDSCYQPVLFCCIPVLLRVNLAAAWWHLPPSVEYSLLLVAVFIHSSLFLVCLLTPLTHSPSPYISLLFVTTPSSTSFSPGLHFPPSFPFMSRQSSPHGVGQIRATDSDLSLCTVPNWTAHI